MKFNMGLPALCLMGIACLSTTACDMREPTPEPAAVDPQPVSATPARGAAEGADSAAKAETQAKLLAGLDAVRPLIKEKVDAYQPVEPLADHRLLLHPGEGKRARLVLDVSTLAGLTLSPVIESFQGNATCEADPSAGVAGLHWQLDDRAVSDVVVDRNYTDTIKIDVAGAKQLVIESSDQNGVIWCDWLAVGFNDVAIK
jgi:hypothetical protein